MAVIVSTIPREIKGPTGEKCKVIFGNNGYEWLLICNNDDGTRVWQTHFWSEIPEGLARQLNNCSTKERIVTAVEFGGANTDSWYVAGEKKDKTGWHAWWGGLSNDHSSSIKEESEKGFKVSIGDQNGCDSLILLHGTNNQYMEFNVSDDLSERLDKIYEQDKNYNYVKLFNDGAYFIKDDFGCEWSNLGEYCEAHIREAKKSIEDVALARDGSWLVSHPNHFVSSEGVDETLTERLEEFYCAQNKRVQARKREIKAFHDRVEAERVAVERERLARLERERQRRLKEEKERKRIERENKEYTERILKKESGKILILFEKQLVKEKNSIKAATTQLAALKTDLRKRCNSLKEGVKALPVSRRAQFSEILRHSGQSKSQKNSAASFEKRNCVICQLEKVKRILIPCGHFCLCLTCIIQGELNDDMKCPLCQIKVSSIQNVVGA